MQELAIVLTIAVLALLLAAFTTIAAAIAGNADHPLDARQAIRLRNVLITSFALLIAALIPLPILLLGLADDLAWRIAAGLAAVVTLASNFVGLQTARTARSIEQTSKTVIAASLMLSGATFGCFLLGVVADHPPFWFVTALVLVVLVALLSAVRLLFSLTLFDALT